jgi:hypothetical protein
MKLCRPRLQCTLEALVHIVSSDLKCQVSASESQGRDDALGPLWIRDYEMHRNSCCRGALDCSHMTLLVPGTEHSFCQRFWSVASPSIAGFARGSRGYFVSAD